MYELRGFATGWIKRHRLTTLTMFDTSKKKYIQLEYPNSYPITKDRIKIYAAIMLDVAVRDIAVPIHVAVN